MKKGCPYLILIGSLWDDENHRVGVKILPFNKFPNGRLQLFVPDANLGENPDSFL